MSYINDGNRDLFESILNYDVLNALKSFQRNNCIDCIIINDLAVGYYNKPYRTSNIDILVKNKKQKIKYFPNNKYYKKDIKINVFSIEDFNLSISDYDNIKNNSVYKNDFNIISPTFLIMLYSFNNIDNFKIRSYISKLMYNNKINFNILKNYLDNGKISIINEIIKMNNKDYMMEYLKNYKMYNTCQIYEGTSGYAEVDSAFEDWIGNTKNVNQVLIGGMAIVNYNVDKNRTTQDIDFLFLQKEDIPSEVYKFKKHRSNAFQHNKTHVEIEVLSYNTINVVPELVDLIFDTSYQKEMYKVASPSALIALKLGRFNSDDQSDIISIKNNYDINIDIFKPYLSSKAISNWEFIKDK